MVNKVTRRLFAVTGAAGLGVIGIGGVSRLACGPGEASDAALAANLNATRQDMRFASRLLNALEKEQVAADANAAFQNHAALNAALKTTCPISRRTRIKEICQNDFKAGDCLVIDKLVVSKTECLIAAAVVG